MRPPDRYPDPARTASCGGSWAVYDAEGRLAGTIHLPAGFQPMFIEGDVVAGVIRDEFEVEYVRGYSVEAPPRS